MPREWDARTYDSLPLPHLGWGRRTLGRLPLKGDERVLDAGCGTGRDTEGLLDLLPDGRVVAARLGEPVVDYVRLEISAVSLRDLDLVPPEGERRGRALPARGCPIGVPRSRPFAWGRRPSSGARGTARATGHRPVVRMTTATAPLGR